MNPSSTASQIASKSSRGIPLSYFVFALLGLIVAACFVLIFGRVHGEEFSPEAFRRRSYHFYQIPFVRLQIGPVIREDISSKFEEQLAGEIQGLPLQDPAVEWDIVTSSAYPRDVYQGDAKLLCDFLDLKNNNSKLPVWRTWTNDHPDEASVFWPVAAAVAKARLYVLLPELFAIAEAADTAAQLEERASRYVATEALQIGTSRQAMDSHALAIVAFDLALKMQPDSAEARMGKRFSEQALQSAGSPVQE